MGATELEETPTSPLVNRNLITLKVVLFLVYGGLASLYSTLIPHMLLLGLNYNESRIILIVSPLIALIGPLAIAPLTDRLASKKQALSGQYLRVLIAVTLVLAAIVYATLLSVPTVVRSASRRPEVSFGCDASGAIIFQERCSDEKTCYHWAEEKVGSLVLTNCSYSCQNPAQFERLYTRTPDELVQEPEAASTESTSSREQEDDDYEAEASPGDGTDGTDVAADGDASAEQRRRRNSRAENRPNAEPPHLCELNMDRIGDDKVERCHAFTPARKQIDVRVTLRSATNQENDTHSAEWCTYPLDGFQCRVPQEEVDWIRLYTGNKDCKPMVECQVLEPYDTPGSVLAESQCMKIIGDIELTFWSYLFIRSIGDLFVATAITLLNTAIIIATRETSAGRGDVGRQLAWASLGWALFPLVLGLSGVHDDLLVAVIVFVVCAIVAAVVLLLAKQMPLSPPEWWWHTKSGMLAIPLSAIRKYGPEIAAVALVAVMLGAFWSVIDTYQTWHLLGLDVESGSSVLKYSLTVVALPSMILLWHSEVFVDYCGHSNILMTAFTVYILRYTGLALIDHPWWALFMAAMEPVTLSITWVTLVLYMRHLVPRRLTTCGQAIPVIAFFCLGKSIGAMLGLVKEGPATAEVQRLYTGMAVAACVIAVLYFILYNCVLAPRCAAQPEPRESQAELPGANGNNGSYSPLRVYHNGRGRKGEFRY